MRTIVSSFLKYVECFRPEFYKSIRKTFLTTNILIHVNRVYGAAATSCNEEFLSPFYTLSSEESPESLRAATNLEDFQDISHTHNPQYLDYFTVNNYRVKYYHLRNRIFQTLFLNLVTQL